MCYCVMSELYYYYCNLTCKLRVQGPVRAFGLILEVSRNSYMGSWKTQLNCNMN